MKKTYWRFVLPMIVLTLFLVIVLSFEIIFITGRYLQEEKEQSLLSNAGVVSEMSRKYMENPLPIVFKMYQENLIDIAKTNGTSMLFCDMEGNILFVVDGEDYKEPVGQVSADILAQAAKEGGHFFRNGFNNYYKQNVYTYGCQIIGSSGDPFAILFISSSAGVLDRINKYLMLTIFIGALALVIFTGIFVIIYGRRLTSPLQAIENAAKAFAEGDFTVRIKGSFANGESDVARLSQTFNNMAQSLQLQERGRRDFLANITHELRSPMTTIGGFVEAILDGTIPPEKESYYLTIIRDEILRLSRLVSTTLYLFSMQDADAPLNLTKLNLCDLTNRTFVGFEQKVLEKDLKIDILYERDPIFIQADVDSFTRVIYNLIDNAVKYCNRCGSIKIRCIKTTDYAFFVIENTGEGIEKEDLPFVFERYYKSDQSRGLNKTGTGLGLSIVKSIIDRHRAQITLESEPGHFTRFTVQIRLSKDKD